MALSFAVGSVSMHSRNFLRILTTPTIRRRLHIMDQDVLPKPANKQLHLLIADKYLKQGEPRIADSKTRPLVVMIAWLMAKRKHLDKYSEIYLKKGYDVLTVSMSPWDFLWPTTGAQPIAEDLLKYLYENSKQPLFLHGFSAGAYLWGELLIKVASDLPKYEGLISRVKGQIWDSCPDIADMHTGIPKALISNNSLLQSAVTKYIQCHLSMFQNTVTQHYINSSQRFHKNLIKAPILIFISKDDPIATEESNIRVRKSWESLGIRVQYKCWDKSKHVSHLILHRDEYLAELNAFLASLDLYPYCLQRSERIKAKL